MAHLHNMVVMCHELQVHWYDMKEDSEKDIGI